MKASTVSPSALLAALALTCLAAIGAALASQHYFDMQPCPWCVLQRLLFVLVAAVCVLGLLWRGLMSNRVVGGLLALLAVSGMAAALWQHFVAAASASCNLTLADRIISGLKLDSFFPEIFQARASCAEAAVNLLGLPYAFYSLALFAISGLVAARLLVRGARANGA